MNTIAVFIPTLRGVHLLALLLLLGTLVALILIAPPSLPGAGPAIASVRRHLLSLTWLAAATTLLTGVAWLILQAIAIGVPSGLSQTFAVVMEVIRATRFGQLVTVRLGLILLVLPLLRPRRWRQIVALAVVVLATALQGNLGHAGAVGGAAGDGLVASEALHLVAAGAWLGALPSLLLLLIALPPAAAAMVCRRFSPIGLAAVLLLMGTALAQATALIGDIPGLLGTGYGHIALLKLGLFVALLALAMVNRFALTTRLERIDPGTAQHWMRLSIVAETAIGVAVVLAASWLASGVPAVHEQPTWPFSWRPSLAAMADRDLRHEVADALIGIGCAIVIAVVGLPWRRLRWAALAVAAMMVWFAAPHLGLLLVEAFPTSYYTSPTGFSAESISRGATLFAANCVACHGVTGHGDGPLAAQLPVHPADLTAPHLWEHRDGDLYWWISDGIDASEGGTAMPGFAAMLSTDDRWALIDYVRAHNAGTAIAAAGAWPAPVQAPSLPLDCDGIAADETADLAGAVLRVIADKPDAGPGNALSAAAPVPPQDGVRTIIVRLSPARTDRPAAGECVAETQSAWPAYAVLAGLDPALLGGTEFLVDPAGWLRALWRPDRPGGWRTQDQLIAEIRQICTHPIETREAASHAHHH